MTTSDDPKNRAKTPGDGKGGSVTPVSAADIREKLEELKDSAVAAASKGGAAWAVGALLGAAAAVAAAFLAGRRSCR